MIHTRKQKRKKPNGEFEWRMLDTRQVESNGQMNERTHQMSGGSTYFLSI